MAKQLTSVVGVVGVVVIVLMSAAYFLYHQNPAPPERAEVEYGKHYTLKELEAEGLRATKNCAKCDPVPFGVSSWQWKRFIAQWKEGDDIRAFTYDEGDAFGSLHTEGLHLLRNGNVVAELLTGIVIEDNAP